MFVKLRPYWSLIKSLQTGLLLSTGLAGYMSARCPIFNLGTMVGLGISLFLSISGSTILNMWWDRDIDSRMTRTKDRPLASGQIAPNEALRLGLLLSLMGVGLAVAMDALYGLILVAGIFFDVVIYSMWLKRRTAWGILWGGISGGMPILAGRVLGVGGFDWVGITLALGILFWIPTHILTFSMRYFEDYKTAGIPTFPSIYGFHMTRITIAVSSILASLAMGAASLGIGMTFGYLRVLFVLSIGLLCLATWSVFKPTERTNFGLFKYASLYMLSSMILMMV
jgi:protoheme IX farnesyltransferase